MGCRNIHCRFITLCPLHEFRFSYTLPNYSGDWRLHDGSGFPSGNLIYLLQGQTIGVINFITIPGLVGPIIGPTLGGWLVDVASWHWNFLINIPIGIAGILFARKYMPDYVNKGKKFDLTGMLLFSGSLLLLTIAIELGSEKSDQWLVAYFGIFATGILLMNLYYRHFKKVDNPLIDLNLIK